MTDRRPAQRFPRDLHEAAEALVAARDTPTEEDAWLILRRRLAENRAIPGETERTAQWRIARTLFDNIARAAEADARFRETGEKFARFIDLDRETQWRIASGLSGVLGQFAQVARKKGSK